MKLTWKDVLIVVLAIALAASAIAGSSEKRQQNQTDLITAAYSQGYEDARAVALDAYAMLQPDVDAYLSDYSNLQDYSNFLDAWSAYQACMTDFPEGDYYG